MDRTEELIRRSQDGDKEAREALIEENMGLVHHVVKRFLGRGVEAEDLFQIGAIGLLKAVFAAAADFQGEMPGKSPVECGNYINLDVETGRKVCRFYDALIRDWTVEQLAYPAAGQ